jgi:hypothetical protein
VLGFGLDKPTALQFCKETMEENSTFEQFVAPVLQELHPEARPYVRRAEKELMQLLAEGKSIENYFVSTTTGGPGFGALSPDTLHIVTEALKFLTAAYGAYKVIQPYLATKNDPSKTEKELSQEITQLLRARGFKEKHALAVARRALELRR